MKDDGEVVVPLGGQERDGVGELVVLRRAAQLGREVVLPVAHDSVQIGGRSDRDLGEPVRERVMCLVWEPTARQVRAGVAAPLLLTPALQRRGFTESAACAARPVGDAAAACDLAHRGVNVQ
jgi:hypothetical protein